MGRTQSDRGRRAVRLMAVVFAGFAIALAGCRGPESRLPAIARKAASAAAAPGGAPAARTAAAAELAKAWADGMRFGEAIDFAYERLDQDPGATVFAGAVLDAIATGGDEVGTGGEFEIFWMKVGRLACKAADTAMANNRLAEARSLVLAGSQRWQNDSYWRRYPDHDALAAVILAASGERDVALQRLRSREELESPAREVYEQIQRAAPPPVKGR